MHARISEPSMANITETVTRVRIAGPYNGPENQTTFTSRDHKAGMEDALSPVTSQGRALWKKRMAVLIFIVLSVASLVAVILAISFLCSPTVKKRGIATIHVRCTCQY